MTDAWEWLNAHPLLVGLLALWILTSLAHLPPPSDPRVRVLWEAMVRVTFLSWDRYGGRFKLPGAVYPQLPRIDSAAKEEMFSAQPYVPAEQETGATSRASEVVLPPISVLDDLSKKRGAQ